MTPGVQTLINAVPEANIGLGEDGETILVVSSWHEVRRITEALRHAVGLPSRLVKVEDGRLLIAKSDAAQEELVESLLDFLGSDQAPEGPTGVYDGDMAIGGAYRGFWRVDTDSVLEHLAGIHIGFDDEHRSCDDCGVIVYTTDGAERYAVLGDRLVCRKCILGDKEAFLSDVLEHPRIVNFIPELADVEYEPVLRDGEPWAFESGLHRGMADNPHRQRKLLKALDVPVVFKITPSQFYMSWTLGVPAGMGKLVARVLEFEYRPDAEGPGDRAERALRNVSMLMKVPTDAL